MSTQQFIRIPFAFLMLATATYAATINIAASKDTSIYQSSPNNSGGGAAGIFVGSNGQGSSRRGLIAFDLAGQVPAGSIITSAQLTLCLGAGTSGGNVSIDLHRLTTDWGEGTAGSANPTIGGGGGGFAAAAGDATWMARFYSPATPTLWFGPGASGDFDPVASATVAVGGPVDSPRHWLSTPALVSDVQSWLDFPVTNYGWLLLNANESSPGTVRAFYSSEATLSSTGGALDPTSRPTLTVTYVPEPSAAILLMISLLTFGFQNRSFGLRNCERRLHLH